MQRPGALFVALVGTVGFEQRARKPGLNANTVDLMAESAAPGRIGAAGQAHSQVVITTSTNTMLQSDMAMVLGESVAILEFAKLR